MFCRDPRPEEAIMIDRVKIVGICVRDQAKARAFYTDKLGFEVRRDDPMGPSARWLEVAPKGGDATLVLFTPPGLESRIGSFTNVVLECDDAERTYQELSARGVEFKEKPTKQSWGGIQAIFHDQDGNSLVLVQAGA
jgi:catechol 2,3-dioxygenase-like lactoylglutathione lyase family enzyme